MFVPGTSVRYKCDPGYVLMGKTALTCLTSGVWSIPYPQCKGEQKGSGRWAACTGEHGGVGGQRFKGFKPMHSFLCGCSLNFDLKTQGEAWLWQPLPQLRLCCSLLPAVTCMSPSIKHGEVAEGQQAVYLPGTIITIRCHPGYMLRGSQEPKCHSDGRWVPSVPSCEPGEHGHSCCWLCGKTGAGQPCLGTRTHRDPLLLHHAKPLQHHSLLTPC